MAPWPISDLHSADVKSSQLSQVGLKNRVGNGKPLNLRRFDPSRAESNPWEKERLWKFLLSDLQGIFLSIQTNECMPIHTKSLPCHLCLRQRVIMNSLGHGQNICWHHEKWLPTGNTWEKKRCPSTISFTVGKMICSTINTMQMGCVCVALLFGEGLRQRNRVGGCGGLDSGRILPGFSAAGLMRKHIEQTRRQVHTRHIKFQVPTIKMTTILWRAVQGVEDET